MRGVRAGDATAIAAALARVEDTRPESLELRRARCSAGSRRETPRERAVVGLTGPPGAGKSTLAGALIARLARRGTRRRHGRGRSDAAGARGGALLGDRARLRFRPDERVFVRSMAARDQLGGLAPATRAAVVVLRAAFDWVLVETVGVGQSEIDIETVAETVVLVLQPGSGDTLQFMKAGILEIPDVLVVHKWDLGAQRRAHARGPRGLAARWRRSRRARGAPPVIGASSRDAARASPTSRARSRATASTSRTASSSTRRARGRAAWALELFVRRYGTLGARARGRRARPPRQLVADERGLRARRVQRARQASRTFRVGVVELERLEQRVEAW